MPLYFNELAPWERKSQYYEIIQLGKDVEKQTATINNQTEEMIAAQMESTNAIVASQERVSERLDILAYGLDRVEQGIFGLKSAFEWGISDVIWQIEQNREVLREILEVLMAPLDTQAKERKKRAEEAFANGWINDAEEEFLESEKFNKYDFSIHMSLGIIYLFHKINKEKALSYFEKAIKYSKPKSAYYNSCALLYKALIKFDFGEIKDAEKYTAEAIALSPDFAEAHYQNAQYNAQLNEIEKSISSLEKAIKKDKHYCVKTEKDSLFNPIRKQVIGLFEKLRYEEKQEALKSLNETSSKQKKLDIIVSAYVQEEFACTRELNEKKKLIGKIFSDIKKGIELNSYFDFLDVNNIYVPELRKNQNELLLALKLKIQSTINNSTKGITNKETENKKEIKKLKENTLKLILIGSFIVPAVMSLIALEGGNRISSFIYFCVPVLSQIVSLGFIGNLIFKYHGWERGELLVAWCIVMFLVASVTYFIVSIAKAKAENTNEINDEISKLQKAMALNEETNKI